MSVVWHAKPKTHENGDLSWPAYGAFDGGGRVIARNTSFSRGGWKVDYCGAGEQLLNKSDAVIWVERLCKAPLFPEWLVAPTTSIDGRAMWQMSFNRRVTVQVTRTGWWVRSPECIYPQGTAFNARIPGIVNDLARYVDSQLKLPARVVLESPYAGNVEANMTYARRALLDSLRRGEGPIMSHLLHTQVLDDTIPEDRRIGIDAGHAWLSVADGVVVYEDLGISKGMQAAIDQATRLKIPVEYRKLVQNGKWPIY